MKSPSEEKTRRDRGRRAKTVKSVAAVRHSWGIEPRAPVLPDVYTKDRRSIHQFAKNNQDLSLRKATLGRL
jgi:hypothetical protein